MPGCYDRVASDYLRQSSGALSREVKQPSKAKEKEPSANEGEKVHKHTSGTKAGARPAEG